MVMLLMRMVLVGLGLEPSEFPRTETGRATGWEDDTIYFSIEPPSKCCVSTISVMLELSILTHENMSSFLEKELATGRARSLAHSLSLSLPNHLLSCDINWGLERVIEERKNIKVLQF